SSDFEPDKYHDEYREQLLGLIDQKAAGEEIVAQPEPEAPAKVLDLMAALEASLKRAERDGGSAAAGDREDDEDDEVAPSASAAKSRPRKAAASKAAKKAKPAAAKKAPPKKRTA
ncbi:MAG: Ku protein, partial [Acidimicrobiia bacterium]